MASDADLFSPYVGIPCISDCVMAELEKLGQKYRLALRFVASVPSFPLPFANATRFVQSGARPPLRAPPVLA